ncbi:MAG: AAA family ATPase [Lentisphaeria bacterium]
MYYDYFGFKESPFRITPDPKYLFFSEQHRDALNYLVYGIRDRKGFIQVTGEVGAGKTTVCRAFFNELDNGTVTGLILNPMLSGPQLLRAVLTELEVPGVKRDRLQNYELLNQFLLQKLSEKTDVVLVVDEAQDLSGEMLEMIRLLSNLETDNQKLIQIVLMGQPELRDKLNKPALRQLRQRITVRYHINPLTEDETRRYLQHRITIAGGQGVPWFDKAAVRRIYRYSKGIPRMINAIADKSLLAGYVQRKDHITGRIVRRAEKEMEDKES